jgi:hypothetical protein
VIISLSFTLLVCFRNLYRIHKFHSVGVSIMCYGNSAGAEMDSVESGQLGRCLCGILVQALGRLGCTAALCMSHMAPVGVVGAVDRSAGN